jgi:hypothetical protein
VPENAYTALHTDLTLAADGGNADRVDELLKEGADPNRSAPGGATPLIAAMTSYRPGDRQRIIDALLEAGADPSKADDKGNTPLMRAIDDPLTLMRQLLEAGADPNHVNNDGESAMDTALEFLPSTEHIDGRGRSPRQLANRYGYWDLVELFGGKRPAAGVARVRKVVGVFLKMIDG